MSASDSTATVIVDDIQSSQLMYSEGWIPEFFSGAYQQTVHTSNTTKQGPSLLFSFTGTSISVYGRAGNAMTALSYIVDDGPTTSREVPAANDSSIGLLFGSPTLDYRLHTLALTINGPGALSVDYVTYDIPTPSFGSSPAPSPDSGPTSSPSAAQDVASSGISAGKAALVGTVVGLGVFLIASASLYLFFRMRQKRSTTGHLYPAKECQSSTSLAPQPQSLSPRRTIIVDDTSPPSLSHNGNAYYQPGPPDRRIARWLQSVRNSGYKSSAV